MWIDIIGFEDSYCINEYGDVLNKKTNKIMKYYINNKGYKCIDLTNKEGKHKFLVHRLVAFHFVENPYSYPIVLHLDNNKLNTHYTNLKWGTYSENNAQAIRDGLNSVPRPDNRKLYQVYNSEMVIDIFCGVRSIIETGGYGTECIMRNSIFRNEPLKGGKFEGCNVQRVKEIINPIRFI